MCDFLSAIYTRDGRLLHKPGLTNSHSHLAAMYGVQERQTDAPVQQFVRLELTPPSEDSDKDLFDFSKWREDVDEWEVPEWFDAAAKFDAFEQMRELLVAASQRPPGMYTGELLLVREGFYKATHCYVLSSGSAEVHAYKSVVRGFGEADIAVHDCDCTVFDKATCEVIGGEATFYGESSGTVQSGCANFHSVGKLTVTSYAMAYAKYPYRSSSEWFADEPVRSGRIIVEDNAVLYHQACHEVAAQERAVVIVNCDAPSGKITHDPNATILYPWKSSEYWNASKLTVVEEPVGYKFRFPGEEPYVEYDWMHQTVEVETVVEVPAETA